MANNPTLTPSVRRCKELVEKEGVVIESWDMGRSAHVKFRCLLPFGIKRMLVVPGSGSDHRGEKNMVALVRRWMREPEPAQIIMPVKPAKNARKPH